ncbi:MAG TPA: TldD/PmbA family protein [Thermodesulfobacteriota bacterium]
MRGNGFGEDQARDLLHAARKAGATAGDVVYVEADRFAGVVRLREVDRVKQARERTLGLRLFVGRRSATASTADLSKESLARLVADTVAMARATAEDPAAGLPEDDGAPGADDGLALRDERVETLAVGDRLALARDAEAAALAADPRIVNSEGAGFDSHAKTVVYANTAGFSGSYRATAATLWVSSIAADPAAPELGMQRDGWYTSARALARLEAPADVGRTAALRAVRRLGARKVATCEVPVVFDPEAAASLLRALAQAVNGQSIYRGGSFLAGKLGERVASDLVTVVDDGRLVGGLGSRPFDAEGLSTRRTVVLDRGVLRSYLLDAYSARKLGLEPTGNASRSPGEAPVPAPTNFMLVPPADAPTPEAIIRGTARGLYVTDMIGFGVNVVTGDYSRGAAGFWIENGELAYPVEEITVAGNLARMLADVDAVGRDLDLRASVAAPTIRVARMTVAGR